MTAFFFGGLNVLSSFTLFILSYLLLTKSYEANAGLFYVHVRDEKAEAKIY